MFVQIDLGPKVRVVAQSPRALDDPAAAARDAPPRAWHDAATPTLEALSARNWRRTDAARLLHLNRQALYARIERIERLLDTELNDPESRLALELALRVHRQTAGERI
jgi:DNA-binding NtrC family response regulator